MKLGQLLGGRGRWVGLHWSNLHGDPTEATRALLALGRITTTVSATSTTEHPGSRSRLPKRGYGCGDVGFALPNRTAPHLTALRTLPFPAVPPPALKQGALKDVGDGAAVGAGSGHDRGAGRPRRAGLLRLLGGT